MVILNGQKLADRILSSLTKEIRRRRLKLKLAVVLVGNDKASKIYVRKKELACKKIGADFKLFRFSAGTKTGQLEKEIKKIVEDSANSGIVIQLPLPARIATPQSVAGGPKKLIEKTQDLLNLIPPEKDVDVLSKNSFEKFAKGKSPILPPTVAAISYFLKIYKIKLRQKYVVVLGAGRLVGKPLAAFLRLQKVNFSILDKSTEDLSFFTKKADILISGVGKAGLVAGDMVRQGVVAIDVGGDIDFKSVSKKAAYITPTIGGVGPMTVACLLENLVKLNK